ncbi:MAG: TatD family hydrolase [bacterium]|nr:TatD family hydrolase [bacterium]
MLIDTHCHLQFRGYNEDREEVIKRVIEKGVVLNIVGTQKNTSKLAVELAEKYDNFYATIGTHPVHLFPTYIDEEESSFISREESFDVEYYSELVKSKKVIAIGETGLDLYHLPNDHEKSPDGSLVAGKSKEEVLERQKEVFLAHVNFAEKHNLPLVIHCREAHNEMIEILSNVKGQRSNVIKGVIHCFTGNWGHAQKYLDLGLHLGFTGVVTFPPKKTDPQPQIDLLDVLKRVPLDRILVETDAPYLAPQVCRGKRCEPWMVEEVVKKLAEVRGIRYEEARDQTNKNATNLFTGINLKLG